MERNTSPLYQVVYEEVINRIVSGELKKGMILSTNAEIATKYGIALSTVRAAFHLLQQEGYIKPVQKTGTIIIRDTVPGDSVEAYLLERKDSYLDVCSMLKMILPDLLAYGASLCPYEKLAAFRGRVEGVGHVLSAQQCVFFWRDFCTCILSPIDNVLIRSLLSSSSSFLFYPLIQFLRPDYCSVYRSDVPDNLMLLLGYIKARDFDHLRQTARDWLGEIGVYLEEYLGMLDQSKATGETKSFLWFPEKSVNRLYSNISDSLLRGIVLGYYPYGSYLPSQSELRREHQVSLTPVQSALNILATMGVIRYASGKGYLVESNGSTINPNPTLSKSNYADALEILLLTCHTAAGEAFPYLTEKDILTFEESDRRLYQQPGGEFYSSSFHLMELWISRIPDPVTRFVYHQLVGEIIYGTHYQTSLRKSFVDRHLKIRGDVQNALDCVKKNDCCGFQDAILQMLESIRDYVAEVSEYYQIGPNGISLPETAPKE